MDIPTILSGPIVRRAEESQIYIWIATSEPFEIKADLYQVDQTNNDTFDYTLLSKRSKTESIKVGRRLYTHLIKIGPEHGRFPTNQLLGYNLNFGNKEKLLDLESFGLLSPQNPHSIVYGDLKYPTFYLNDQENNNILYGSCRQPHGKGFDALTSADIAIEESYENLDNRPSTLFMMGDQIYADDVADPLICFLSDLGEELIGKKENLTSIEPLLKKEPFNTSLFQINGRQFIMERFAKFTSNNASNHLIQLGEYAAMYLLSWGPQLWDVANNYGVFDSFEDKVDNDGYYFIYPNQDRFEEEHKEEYQQLKDRHQEQVQDIKRFQQNLFRVRRALANTPTYMIFDDHDITDDWNLTSDWKSKVADSPLGRHVIANGLGAYWLFQGFGNDPNGFVNSFKQTVSEYLQTIDVDSSIYNDWVQLLWEFDSWHYVTPTNPKAVVLDTRTWRAYDLTPEPAKIGSIIKENIRSPKLISREGWKHVTKRLKESKWKSGQKLMVVSPTPLYGIGLIESFLDDYIYPLRTLGVSIHSMIDFEAWKYNGEGFNEFQQWIAKWSPSHCFILSGDVHYASSVKSIVDFKDGRHSNIYQFTSSPMNNMSFSSLWGFLMKRIIWLNTLKRKRETFYRYCGESNNLAFLEKDQSCPETYQWKETIKYLATKDNNIIETQNNIGLLSIEESTVQNSLLQYYGLFQNQIDYDKLSLK